MVSFFVTVGHVDCAPDSIRRTSLKMVTIKLVVKKDFGLGFGPTWWLSRLWLNLKRAVACYQEDEDLHKTFVAFGRWV